MPVHLVRKVVITVAATGLAATLAACGDDDPAGSGSAATTEASAAASAGASEFNAQDSGFATTMIMHHQEAIEMAKLAPGRSTDQKVLALAKRIEAAQAPEIGTMSGLLDAWGEPMPSHGPGMDMGDMPGAMSAEDMSMLESMQGKEFDEMFLTMMTTHHQGAITVAETEVSSGANPEAKALAQKVIDDQTREIAEIRTMLG